MINEKKKLIQCTQYKHKVAKARVQDSQEMSDNVSLQVVSVYALSGWGLSADRPIQGHFFLHFFLLSAVTCFFYNGTV